MILALDPSYSNFGCSVFNARAQVVRVGTIQTQKTKNKLLRVADDDVRRITHISTRLSRVIKTCKIQGVLAELPPSNSKSAAAAKGLGIAVAIAVSLFTELDIPVEWATPEEVKKALTGKANASKDEMMLAACKKHGWNITEKEVYARKTGKLQRIDRTFHVLGKDLGKNKFEHIADSIGAFEALRHSNVARMLLERKAA